MIRADIMADDRSLCDDASGLTSYFGPVCRRPAARIYCSRSISAPTWFLSIDDHDDQFWVRGKGSDGSKISFKTLRRVQGIQSTASHETTEAAG